MYNVGDLFKTHKSETFEGFKKRLKKLENMYGLKIELTKKEDVEFNEECILEFKSRTKIKKTLEIKGSHLMKLFKDRNEKSYDNYLFLNNYGLHSLNIVIDDEKLDFIEGCNSVKIMTYTIDFRYISLEKEKEVLDNVAIQGFDCFHLINTSFSEDYSMKTILTERDYNGDYKEEVFVTSLRPLLKDNVKVSDPKARLANIYIETQCKGVIDWEYYYDMLVELGINNKDYSTSKRMFYDYLLSLDEEELVPFAYKFWIIIFSFDKYEVMFNQYQSL